jgi:hypothetical protein
MMLVVADAAFYMMRWPNPVDGPYALRYWVGRVDGRPSIVGIELWGVEPRQGGWKLGGDLDLDQDGRPMPEVDFTPQVDTAITAQAVRIPVGDLLDAATAQMRSYARASRKLYGSRPELDRYEAKLGGGRQRLSDGFLQRVADVYLAAVRVRERSPAAAVKEQLGAPTASTARSWVHQARTRHPEWFTEEEQ